MSAYCYVPGPAFSSVAHGAAVVIDVGGGHQNGAYCINGAGTAVIACADLP